MALVVAWSATALAEDSPKVAVLPFDVIAQQELSYLSVETPKIIQNYLSSDGAQIIATPETTTFNPKGMLDNASAVRALALSAGADYVIWGQLVVQEKQVTVSAKLANLADPKATDSFSASGEGIESISGIVRSLTREIGDKLFQRAKIEEVRVTGNRRIEADAILATIKAKPGDVFAAKRLSEDLKAVYAMGYFEDIRVESQDGSKGKIVIFEVVEKATIKNISFKGNTAIKSEKLTESLDIKTGSIMNINDVRKNVQRVEAAYKDKKYHNVKVSFKTTELKDNQVDLAFIVDEGEKVQIKEIAFVGNSAFSAKKLKKVMKTKEKGFFSWLTSSGEYNSETLNQDIALLSAHYQNNGFIQARIADPEVVQKDNWIYITIKLVEGDRYKVGSINVDGELILSKEELLSGLKLSKEEYFSREVLRKDMLALTEIYSNYGYANADASPDVEPDPEKKVVNVTYTLTKGELIYFDKITISGNTKTRDKVIRRELEVQEQNLYNGAGLKRSVRNLNRLNYFEDVKFDTPKGETPNTSDLKIQVKEKPTGAFTFGGGYSSVENVFVTGSITQENLFGQGQSLTLKALVGSSTSQVLLGFTEPWLFDIPLSSTTTLYRWKRDYDEYIRDSGGGSWRLSYPVWRDTRLFGSYLFDVGKITDVNLYTASQDIVDLKGTFTTSAVTGGINYDTRDKIVNPTQGQNHQLSVQYAGLGGDIGFAKVMAEAGYYHPLFWGTVGFVHLESGYVTRNSGMTLPDYEKFYLGGINSVRGFDWRDIHLKRTVYRDVDNNPDTPDVMLEVEAGGNAMVQGNIEWIIPIVQSAGIMGVLFYDTGNVYEDIKDMDLGNLRQSTGIGFRWYSPMGPIRIEYGHVLDPHKGESSGRWEFTMGTAF
jgi:outer membrane protein insertion porin family